MNKNRKILLCCLLVVIACLIVFQFQDEVNSPEEGKIDSSKVKAQHVDQLQKKVGKAPPSSIANLSKEERKKKDSEWKIGKMLRVLGSSIDFWGKVVDTNGHPIAGADINFSVTTKLSWSFNTKDSLSVIPKKSNADGLFELLNKKGAGVRVNVSAEGYAPSFDDKTLLDMSRANLAYYGEDDSIHRSRPTKDNPMLFVLRKKNPAANLLHSARKRVSLDGNGEMKKISVGTQEEGLDLEVRCWSESPVPFKYGPYDWRAEIRIVGGKLQHVNGINLIEAPNDGYKSVFSIDMNKNLGVNEWSASNSRSKFFWVRTNNGIFSKAYIRIMTGRKHQVDIEVWANLDGNRNFEQ